MPPFLPFYYLCHINPQKFMELLNYFYHPDHLGSSSWITNGSGNAIQHLHYLPFGEDWVDQRNASWNAPYTFSGKEKDMETGYGYFGARYYDSGLSIWLSVDPMSDKYPSMSPYNYCANNPVILVDPDGREIVDNEGGPDGPMGKGDGPAPNQTKSKSTPNNTKQSSPSANKNTSQQNSSQNKNEADIPLTLPSIVILGEVASKVAVVAEAILFIPLAIFCSGDTSQSQKDEMAKSNGNNGGQAKGERGTAKSPNGTANPTKHMKPDPNKPGNVIVKDPHTGKSISKPRPPYAFENQ